MTNGYANPRQLALRTLYEIEKNGAYANIALKKALANELVKPIDRAFVTNIVYGVIKYRLRIDYIIMQFSSVKLKKMSDFVRLILRMGVYQMLFMDKVPSSAAVNESVKLASRYAAKSRGFINGVLRSVERGREGIQYPAERREYLSVYYSYPRELVDRWIDELGEEACERLMEAMNRAPSVTARVNTARVSVEECIAQLKSEGIEAVPGEIRDSLVILSGDAAASSAYANGLLTLQGLSSMLAAQVLDPQDGMTVVDACAAPGGKATYIAQLMHGSGEVIAFDIYDHKIELIRANAARLEVDTIKAQIHDASSVCEEYAGKADRVLVDAPCSGLGIIRKKADIKWRYGDEKVRELAVLQYAILSACVAYVKPGGELVYSTCTVCNAENIEIVQRFLENHPDFEPVDISAYLPDTVKTDTAAKGYAQIYPYDGEMDGFFICKMRRKG